MKRPYRGVSMEGFDHILGDNFVIILTGLKITAGQRTMSGLVVGLTGQTLVWPVILTGHFWMLVA